MEQSQIVIPQIEFIELMQRHGARVYGMEVVYTNPEYKSDHREQTLHLRALVDEDSLRRLAGALDIGLDEGVVSVFSDTRSGHLSVNRKPAETTHFIQIDRRNYTAIVEQLQEE